MVTGLGLLATPAAAPPALPSSPLPGPWRQRRGWDSYPPVKMPRPEIFSKNHSRENTPRVMGPAPKNFKPI